VGEKERKQKNGCVSFKGTIDIKASSHAVSKNMEIEKGSKI
jgi:hypothetical protein